MTAKPYTLYTGYCEEVMKQLPADHFDSCVTDPPYGIRFMGKAWDKFDIEKQHAIRDNKAKSEAVREGRVSNGFGKSLSAGTYKNDIVAMRQFQDFTFTWASEMYRILKPGAHMIVFASPRTYHRMVCGVEEAGFEVRDQIFWVFGSGFPKSHNLEGKHEGYGTALKPAHEPILVARKPLNGTVKSNMDHFGVGALNIAESSIKGLGPWTVSSQPKLNNASYTPGNNNGEKHAEAVSGGENGRWPANLIHDGSECIMEMFPYTKSGDSNFTNETATGYSGNNTYGKHVRAFGSENVSYGDEGSAARFFYCAKTSRLDRNEGCEALASMPLLWSSGTKNPGSFQSEGTDKSSPNNHPTVKPTALMRYLINLVTPKGGHVIDPFSGSGSTGKACMFEKMLYTGIELDEHNINISRARIEFAIRNRDMQLSMFP